MNTTRNVDQSLLNPLFPSQICHTNIITSRYKDRTTVKTTFDGHMGGLINGTLLYKLELTLAGLADVM